MRVHSLVTVIVIALLAVADAQLVSKPNGQEIISSDSLHDSRAVAGENNVPQRLLRRRENANN
ncbi:RxLR effector protein, partial [Phytophthora megakarya]